MSMCIYKINATGKYGYDADSKFPNGRRDGYSILECGLKNKEDAEDRIKELMAEDEAKAGASS